MIIHQAKIEAGNRQVRAYNATDYANMIALHALIDSGRHGAAARFLLQHPECIDDRSRTKP
jgi:hypothetical protein